MSILRSRVCVRHSRTCAGGDPRLRQPALGEQRPQPARVGAIGLGVTLLASQRARLRRLGQVHHHTGARQHLIDEQPARARLHRDLHVLAGELPNPIADRLPIGPEPASQDLARLGVQRIERDLRPVHIKPS
jgi:hypothetical protein